MVRMAADLRSKAARKEVDARGKSAPAGDERRRDGDEKTAPVRPARSFSGRWWPSANTETAMIHRRQQ